MLRSNFALAIAAVVLAGCALAPGDQSAPLQRAGDPLVARLAGGGYVIYIRHGKTDPGFQDKQDKPEWWKSCDARRHRPLSDEGRAQMDKIGMNMRALRIPVAKVITSEYCRAVDSGLLLQLMPVVQDPALNHSDAQRYAKRTDVEMIAGLRALFSEKQPAGKNTVLVGHVVSVNPPIDHSFVQAQEAEAVIVRPLGEGKFEIAGRVKDDRWGLREK